VYLGYKVIGVTPPTSQHHTNIKKVLTSEGNRRTDLETLNLRPAQQTDLMVVVTSVTPRHDFISAGREGGQRHGES
jgi:hypothetical protein